MLKRIILVVSLGVLLTLALASIGCASSNGLSDMLAKVPAGTDSLKYVDVKALRNDADLSDLYDAWKAAADPSLESRGIDHGSVDLLASGGDSSQSFTILVGKFDLEEIRDELGDRNYNDDEYKGVEVWEKTTSWGADLDEEVALMGDLIIFGNKAGVEGCIKVIKEGAASWISKADIKDVSGRLPSGLYAVLSKTEWTGLVMEGFEALGMSINKQDGDTLKIDGVAKFEDEDSADNAQDTIEYMMEQQFDSVDVTQEGVFLKGSAELDIDDAESLFQGL